MPQGVRTGADVGVAATVIVGWLGVLQPWLTALATILAAVWTGLQLYDRHQRNTHAKRNTSKRKGTKSRRNIR